MLILGKRDCCLLRRNVFECNLYDTLLPRGISFYSIIEKSSNCLKAKFVSVKSRERQEKKRELFWKHRRLGRCNWESHSHRGELVGQRTIL